MRLPGNISKITPPHLANVLYRPRLLSLLEKNQSKKLILILGQPAQGKSTLAASYRLKRALIPSAWMNLDREDSNPINLFYLIVYSLQYVLKDIDLDHLFSYPISTVESRSEIPLFREWTQAIFEQIPTPICIIIDGLDQLSPDAPAFRFLQVLVENSPPNVQLIMLSREIPPLSLDFQNLKMRQGAFILRNEDIAFTQEEIKAFFHEIRKISLDADQLKKIYLATEGWIGGLILLSESLSKFPADTRDRFVSEGLPDHFKREVFQYFGKEILSSQPEQAQEFLIKSSIVDLMEPGLIKELIGIENAEQILRDYARKNLFVQSFYDEKKGWVFRYHQSFRDFLHAKFKSTVGDEEKQTLFLKAGGLYEQRNDLENSVKYFLQAKAYPQAVSVIERLGIDLLRVGRKSDLLQWLNALPEDAVQGNPWLLLYLAVTRRFEGGRENVTILEKVYTLFKERGDQKGSLSALAFLIEASIHTGAHLVPIEKLIDEGEALLQSTKSNKYDYEKAVLWYCLGLSQLLGGGDIRKGVWASQNAYLISKQLRDINLQANALCFSAFGFVLLGEFSSADETRQKIEKLVEKSVYSEFRAIQLMIECLLANHLGDFGKVQGLVENLQGEIEKQGFVTMVPWTYEISGYLEVMGGQFLEAEKIGKQYLSTAISVENGFFKGSALRLLGLIYLHKGDFEKAREVIDGCMNVFSNETPSKYHLNRAKIAAGLICIGLKDYEKAERELNEALQYFSSISSYISLAEVHFATAFLRHDQGRKEDAALHLLNGFKVAEERKYEYFYTLGAKYLLKACLLALGLNVKGAFDYAVHLLSTRLSPLAEEDLRRFSNHPDPKVKEKVWEIRRKIHRSSIPRLRIETLGEFLVYRGDSLIEDKEWDRSQPKQLLKVIVSYRAKKISKEALMDQLWPEERPKAAENDFKTALQRLRKSLEPTPSKDFGSSYIHLYNNVVSIDPELCEVDADEFLFLFKKGEEKEKAGDVKEALSNYNKAIEMYKGDFLADELYIPWADQRREELKGKYIELLGRAAHLHDRQGTVKKAVECYKKAIRADSLLEESYQKLMTLYSSRGMYNEALRTYETCKKVLNEELKTKPDPMTTALYNKILEKIQSS
jgi:ATP/maltotriose-dependent transcriptional regulator MalT/two-component SAPR family response regulator